MPGPDRHAAGGWLTVVSRRRHAPRADLGVGLAFLIGGLGFLLVSLFSGWGAGWSFVGGVAAMTGAGRSYRAGRRIQGQRGRGGPKPPPPSSHRWSESLPWASELYEKKKAKKKGGGKGGKQTKQLPCTPACFNSTAPRADCKCPCGGTRHGCGARNGSRNGRTKKKKQGTP